MELGGTLLGQEFQEMLARFQVGGCVGFSRSLQLQTLGRSCKSFCMSVSGPFAHGWLMPGTFNFPCIYLTLTSAVRGKAASFTILQI